VGEKFGWVFRDVASALFDISHCDAAKLKENERISWNVPFHSTTLNSSSRSICCIGCYNELCNVHWYENCEFHCANVPNHQFVSLLEEAHSEYGELIHHTNIRWICQWVCFEKMMQFV
jgi:hypothetical protein